MSEITFVCGFFIILTSTLLGFMGLLPFQIFFTALGLWFMIDSSIESLARKHSGDGE